MDKKYLRKLISTALREDVGGGDITTRLLFSKHIKVKAKIIGKEDGVVCGVKAAEEVFKAVEREIREDKGKRIRVYNKIKEGAKVKKGDVVCVVEGDARAILTAERTALNFLGHLSGVATLTRKYVEAVRPYKVKIMDTRKTTPGLRGLEKYAVRCGGGYNHRMGLFDQVLVKDNHIKTYTYVILTLNEVKGKDLKKDSSAATRLQNDMRIGELVRTVRKGIKKEIKIEVEVENLREFKEALEAGPDIIMLDNIRIVDIKKAVKIRNRCGYDKNVGARHAVPLLEVSGGVTLANVRAIARTGVDMLSIGALTHSVRALDFSLEVM